MTASLFDLVIARCELPNTITASRHLARVNWTDIQEKQKETINIQRGKIKERVSDQQYLGLTVSLLAPPYGIYIHDDDQETDIGICSGGWKYYALKQPNEKIKHNKVKQRIHHT